MRQNKQDLYISDLDGTLLNCLGEIEDYTREELNKLIEAGLSFTIATARTPATVNRLLGEINITLPVVVMNGACIYNIKTKQYISIKYIEDNIANQLLDILEELSQSVFTYCIKENHIYAYYNEINNMAQESFYKERMNNEFKTFKCGKKPLDMSVAYFVIIDTEEKVRKAYEKIKSIEEINGVVYKDVYLEDSYYLEIYRHDVSKAKAIEDLKQMYQFEKIISFGDNLNDIPMFNISDECYAVANAKEEVKLIATKVIQSNSQNGVVNFIKKKIEKNLK